MTGILPLVTLHHFTLKCYITGEDILEEKKYIAPGELAHGLKIISQFPHKQKILPGFWPTLPTNKGSSARLCTSYCRVYCIMTVAFMTLIIVLLDIKGISAYAQNNILCTKQGDWD